MEVQVLFPAPRKKPATSEAFYVPRGRLRFYEAIIERLLNLARVASFTPYSVRRLRGGLWRSQAEFEDCHFPYSWDSKARDKRGFFRVP